MRTSNSKWVFLAILVLFGLSEGRAEAKLHIYGNWCGPGVGNNSTKKPIDAVDRACKLHDKCTMKMGGAGPDNAIQHCRCDRIIIRELLKAIPRVKNKKKALRAAKVMIGYFKNTACFCNLKVRLKRLVCKKKQTCKDIKKRRCTLKRECQKKRTCKRIFGKERCLTTNKCKLKRTCRTIRSKRCTRPLLCRTLWRNVLRKPLGWAGRCKKGS